MRMRRFLVKRLSNWEMLPYPCHQRGCPIYCSDYSGFYTRGLLHSPVGVLRVLRTLSEWNRTRSHDCSELFWRPLGGCSFTVLKYSEHCSRPYVMECTHCSRTVFSLLHMRATMHYYSSLRIRIIVNLHVARKRTNSFINLTSQSHLLVRKTALIG